MNTQYNFSYIFSITLVATLGGLLFGYDTAVISGTVESLNTVFVAPQNLSESAANSLLGFCVASALIGCIIGGALGGYCSNRFGRRDSLKEVAIKWSAAPDMTPQTVLYRRPVAQFSNFQPKIVSSWLILALFQANFLISGRSRLCPYQLVNSNQVRQGE